MLKVRHGDRLKVLRGERQGQTGRAILIEGQLIVLRMDYDDEEMIFGIGDLEHATGSGLNIQMPKGGGK